MKYDHTKYPWPARELARLYGNSSPEYNFIYTLNTLYDSIRESDGKRKADRWYTRQVLYSLVKAMHMMIIARMLMLKNYLKIAYRNIRKQKGYSIINICGLGIGLACCILILLFVQDELMFDRFHGNADRLYRLNKRFTPLTGGTEYHAISSGRMGPAMVDVYAEVEQCVRLLPWFDDVLMTAGEKTVSISDMVIADENFFRVFDFKLLTGDPKTVLTEPLSIVLSEETAHTWFGEKDPIGASVLGFGGQLYTVTGVAANAPRHSHIRYDVLISWSTTEPGIGAVELPWLNNWLTQVAYTYLLLKPGADVGALENKLPDLIDRHLPEKTEQYHFYLQPFKDIYLRSGHIFYTRDIRSGNITSVYALSSVAILILVIACINFMNLSTARAARRAKEVGLRKVLGAYRGQLVAQFYGESFMLVFLSMIFALTVAVLILPSFNRFTAKALTLNPAGNAVLIVGLPLFILIVGLISGTYPALMLSRYQPVRALKGVWSSISGSASLRKILVTVQFSIAVALIAGTGIINAQMRFTSRKNLGFTREPIVVLPAGDTGISGNYQAFKNTLLRNPSILGVAGSSSVPGQNMMSFGIRPEGKPETENWTVPTIRIDDYDLLDTYGMEMASGRYFSKDHHTDSDHGIVINEALARSLGWNDPVGKKLDVPGEVEAGRVIGVVKDFHMKSFHAPIEPMLIYFKPRYGNVSVRIMSDNIPETIRFIGGVWKQFETRHPFSYAFLEESVARLYESERQMMRTVQLFSVLAVCIACLGLFGLTSYAAERRIKEIGIRKVLGASVPGLFVHLSFGFGKWVLLSNLIAWPVVYPVMNKWLENFAYRVDMTPAHFMLSSLLAMGIALVTISFQTIRAARTNPVDALRYE